MSEQKNYAKYRRELKELCPRMGEKEIYLHWRTTLDKDNFWQIIQEPVLGYYGKYHFVYITIVPSIGKIYVGRHSTFHLDDDYHGSGVKVKELEAQGVELVTIPLEFFRSYELSLGAEAEIVDRMFIIEPDVLNQTIGGDDSRHAKSSASSVIEPTDTMSPVEQSSVEMPFGDSVEVPVMKPHNCPKVVEAPRRTTLLRAKNDSTPKSSPNFCSFEELGPQVGDRLEYVPDPTIFAEVLDSDRRVKCKGKSATLTTTTLKLLGIKYEKGFQPLNYWRWKGKLLIEIREELLKKGK